MNGWMEAPQHIREIGYVVTHSLIMPQNCLYILTNSKHSRGATVPLRKILHTAPLRGGTFL